MAFLEGFIGGLGQQAGQVAQNMLNAQMSRYKGLADMYKSIASNPNIAPPVQQEALRRAGLFTNANPMIKGSMQATKGLENTADIFDAHQNLVTGQNQGQQPSLDFKAASQPQDQSGWQPQFVSQMPDSIYTNGMRDPMRVMQAEAAQKERESYGQANASQQAMLHMINSMQGSGAQPNSGAAPMTSMFGETGAPPGSTLDKLIKDQWTKDMLFKRPPTRPTSAQPLDGHATAFFNGGYFINGEPVRQNAVATRGVNLNFYQDKNTGQTFWDYIAPDDPRLGPNGTLTKPLVQSSTDSTINAATGEKQTATSRRYDGAVGSGGQVRTNTGAKPHAAIPAAPIQGGNPTDLNRIRDHPQTPDEVTISNIFRNPGVAAEMNPLQYSQAQTIFSKYGLSMPTKESLGGPAIHKEEGGYAGLQALHDLVQVVRGNPDVGPVAGRIGQLVNEHFASTGALGGIHKLMGVPTDAEAVNTFVQTVANDPTSIQKIASQLNMPVDRAAQAASRLAYALTRSRALNAAETAEIAGGGGRGITRLFQMMVPYMTNITQDPNFLAGHGGAIADLLGSGIAEVHRTRWGAAGPASAAAIPAQRMQLLKEFGQDSKITGAESSSNSGPTTIQPKSGPMKGKTLYQHKDGMYYEVPENP